MIFAARVSTRPSNYWPPPDSPHARINLSRPHTTTPSGVPQNEQESVVVPRLPNSFRFTKEGNHLKPRRTSHDLAHSTGLPKLLGYNLEWPCITPIQVTLVTGPPAKASHHDTYPKVCRKPPHEPTLHPKPPGAPLAPLGGTWFQTAWRASHTAMRHAPSSSLVTVSPPRAPLAPPYAKLLPGLLLHNSAWRNQPSRQAPRATQV